MFLIRPVQEKDLDRLEELAASIEGGGMTTLPADRKILAAKISASTKNFAATITRPGPETYLLVLEDTATGHIGGTAAVFSRIGLEKAFYTYCLNKTTHVSVDLDHHNTHDVLHLVNDYIGYGEVGSLYLAPEFRKPGNGRLLARARYMLMGANRERFPEAIVAEMRGWQDENGRSAFWEAVGRQFFGMTFHEADHLSAISNNQFIADLMPKFPVYVDLLPQDAKDVIGKPHDDTIPALKLLEWEGFHYQRHVDIFDAGPCVEARLDDIRTIREAHVSTVTSIIPVKTAISNKSFSADILTSGKGANFRCLTGLVRTDQESPDEVEITADVARALHLEKGSTVYHAPFRNKDKSS